MRELALFLIWTGCSLPLGVLIGRFIAVANTAEELETANIANHANDRAKPRRLEKPAQ
jgi:hypothetical protein